MSTSLVLAARALRDALCGFEPRLYSGEDCTAVVAELAATEKACAAARVRAAARAAACGAHKSQGFFDPADWLARETGSSTGEAKAALATAAAVEDCPLTKEALLAGELSLAQAHEITRTEAERPGVEQELLGVAKDNGLRTLKERARKKRLEAVDAEDLHRRQHQAMHVRHWRNDIDNVCFAGELPPELGIPFVNRLDAETDRVRRAAKGEGRSASRQAHAAEAFVRLVAGGGKGKAHSADVVFVCDLRAYRRGHAEEGEACHVIGGGPVPVSVVREIAADAFLKVAFHDGVKIDTIAHLGRHIPAELRTALELGAPPHFEGVVCVEEGCDRRYGLQWDHVDPVANRGVTSYRNLKPRCWPDHQEKTRRDREAGLLRGPRKERDPP